MNDTIHRHASLVAHSTYARLHELRAAVAAALMTLTALLLRRGIPEMGTMSELYRLVTRPVLRLKPVNCTVAPSRESSSEPISPAQAAATNK